MARALVKTHFKRLTCILKDIKPNATAGGTFTAGAWQTRDLNYVEGDQSFITLPVGFDDNTFDNNGGTPDVTKQRFTLEAGEYEIETSAPAHQVARHKAKLRNITTGIDDIMGDSNHAASAGGVTNKANLEGNITLATASVFEIQHRCETSQVVNGFGVESTLAVDEIYTQVKITKIG